MKKNISPQIFLAVFLTVLILSITNTVWSASKPSPTSIEKLFADIPFRSYRNINSTEAKELIKKIQTSNVSLSQDSWEDLIIRGRTKFEQNKDWYDVVRTTFEQISKDDLQSRREFLRALDDLETKDYETASELRDFLRKAKLIDIAK